MNHNCGQGWHFIASPRWTRVRKPQAGWVPVGTCSWAAWTPCVTVRPPLGDFQPFQGKPGWEVESPLTTGKLLQLWSIRKQSLQPLTFIKPPSPSSVSVRWGCLQGHSLIKSECPEGPRRPRGGGRGLRESGERGDREVGRGSRGRRGRASVQSTPVCFAIVQLMPGSDILRDSGDSFGDIPVCDSITNLYLCLILESVETAQRMAVWGCWSPVFWTHCWLPLCQPRLLGTRAKVQEGRGLEIKSKSSVVESGSGLP